MGGQEQQHRDLLLSFAPLEGLPPFLRQEARTALDQIAYSGSWNSNSVGTELGPLVSSMLI